MPIKVPPTKQEPQQQQTMQSPETPPNNVAVQNQKPPVNNQNIGGKYDPLAHIPEPTYKSQAQILHKVIINMTAAGSDPKQTRLLLGGATGLGKTSFAEQLGELLGIGTLIIEIPHLVEEHIVNIPFIVKTATGDSYGGNTQIKSDQKFEEYNNDKEAEKAIEQHKFEIVNAQSNMLTEIDRLVKIPDNRYDAHIKQLNPYQQKLLNTYIDEYGSEDLMRARNNWDRLLFLDEYLRTTTPTIRALLRGVLNGRIGNDPIPPKTMVLYASNTKDISGAIEKLGAYQHYAPVEFKAPSFLDWLYYTVSKGVGKVEWKKPVIDSFLKHMKDEHVSINDVVRTSPRRWSEILLYLNNMYPFQRASGTNFSDYDIAHAHMKAQFTDDQGSLSQGFTVFDQVIKDLALESGITAPPRKIGKDQWRTILNNVIRNALAIGSSKKYVPVIIGEPGIGKTAIYSQLESRSETGFNLRTIQIECTTITAEEVIGIPFGDDIKKGEKETKIVKFSKPALYATIKELMTRSVEAYKQVLLNSEAKGELGNKSAKEVYKEWLGQKYRYAILFDEVNRVEGVKVFNSLRKLILTKEFNPKYSIADIANEVEGQKGTVSKDAPVFMIATMNPGGGDAETQELTDHFRDAIEIVHAEGNWKDFIGYMNAAGFNKVESEYGYNPEDDAAQIGRQFILGIPRSPLAVKGPEKEEGFWWRAGSSGTTIRVDPRALEHTYRALVKETDNVIKVEKSKGRWSAEHKEEIIAKIAKRLTNLVPDYFTKSFENFGYEGITPEFEETFNKYVSDIANNVINIKTIKEVGLSLSLENFLQDPKNDLADDLELDDYMSNFDAVTFRNDFEHFLTNLYKSSTNLNEFTENSVRVVEGLINAAKIHEWSNDINNQIYPAIEEVYRKAQEDLGDDVDSLTQLGRSYNRVFDSVL